MSLDAYNGPPSEAWQEETKRRVAIHPVLGNSTALLEWTFEAWNAVWGTQVGCGTLSVPFRNLNPRAQIVGDFFESVLALRLSQLGTWRRGSSKQKDLVFTGDTSGRFDFEIKTSGQRTGKIYGNRSYAQPGEDGIVESQSRKGRSGYYLCVNFWEESIYRIRVGWIDAHDWTPQNSPTGQMAGLKDHVYQHKLLSVQGDYYFSAPLVTVDGLGEKTCDELSLCGVRCISELLERMSSQFTDPESIRTTLFASGVRNSTARRAARALAESSYFDEAARRWSLR